MHVWLRPLVKWPGREELMMTNNDPLHLDPDARQQMGIVYLCLAQLVLAFSENRPALSWILNPPSAKMRSLGNCYNFFFPVTLISFQGNT